MSKTFVAVVLAVAIVFATGAYILTGRDVQAPVITGAVAGPVLESEYWTVNSVEHQYRSTNFSGATSTPCSWRSPAATSTLLFTSFQITNSSSTAILVTLATSTIPNSTSTSNKLVNEYPFASDVKGVIHYKGTTTSGVFDELTLDTLAPNTYLTWGVEGFGGYTASGEFGGTCKAEFLVN